MPRVLPLVLLLAALPAAGQPAPRFGLALSGGGARGLAHVGVLQVLEDAGLAPDLVTGISMGAVVGGLYAAGLSPDSIAALARHTDWRLLVTGTGGPTRAMRRGLNEREMLIEVPVSGLRVALPSGLSTGQQASAYLAKLTWPVRDTGEFRELPVPFAAVAADLGTGEAVRLSRGNLAQSIRASLAIPMVFVPVEIDGRVLVDGGLARALPAEDARALGAEVLACVDVATPIRPPDSLVTVADVFGQTTSLLTADADSLQRTLCDVVVTPELGDLAISSFGEADKLIAIGADAARAALPRLRTLLGARPAPQRRAATAPAMARIAVVRFENDHGHLSERWMRAVAGLDLRAGEVVELDGDEVDAAVAALFGTGAFETVLYRIRQGPEGDTLVVTVSERPRGRAGAGLRFDTENRAAAIARLRYGHLLRPGSLLEARLRLGQEIGAWVRYDAPIGLAGPFGAAIEAGAAESFRPPPATLDDGGADSLALVPTNTTAAWLQAGLTATPTSNLVFELQGRAETFLAELQRTGAPGDGQSFVGAAVTASYETLDRSDWPRRGHAAHARVMSAAGVGSQGGFRHASAELASFLPLGAGATGLLKAAAGASGGDVPAHMAFRAGGIGLEPPGFVLFDFPGYASRSLSGSSVAIGTVGLRWEAMPGRFLTGRVAAGRDDASGRVRAGLAVSAGADSVLGPVELTLMAPTDLSPIRLQFALGHRF